MLWEPEKKGAQATTHVAIPFLRPINSLSSTWHAIVNEKGGEVIAPLITGPLQDDYISDPEIVKMNPSFKFNLACAPFLSGSQAE